jgi:hypothetical protein
MLRDRLDDELREEIRLHVEMRRDALVEAGVDPRDAEAEAHRMFGNLTAYREETRDMWGFPALDTIAQDVRYAIRTLGPSRAFTATVVLSLALGIGASAAVFSLADTVLLRKLPVRNPDQLVILRWFTETVLPFESLNGSGAQDESGSSSTSFPLAAYKGMQKATAGLVDLFGFADLSRVNVQADGRSELVVGWRVAAFTMAAACGSALLFGMVPALRATSLRVSPGLQEAGAGRPRGCRQPR